MKHQCKSEIKGNKIIYTCPLCDYKRIFDMDTGKMIFEGTQTEVLHKGEVIPVGTQPDKMNLN